MVTWGDIIDIIMNMFEVKQTKIAQLMHLDKSAISRMRSGKRLPSFTAEEMFSNLFDSANPDSLAGSNESDKHHLDTLKGVIESDFAEVRKDMDDSWNEENYKKFVLKLLGRARQGASTKKGTLPSDYENPTPSGAEKTDMSTVSDEIILPIRKKDRAERRPQTGKGTDLVLNSEDVAISSTGMASDNTPVENSRMTKRQKAGRENETAADQKTVAVTNGGGAQLYIEDKYHCCNFCANWNGSTDSKFAVCSGYKEMRKAQEGKECIYFEPNEARISVETMKIL